MGGLLKSVLIQNKAMTVGNCSRRILAFLVITCTVVLLVENDLLQNVYTVYVFKHNATSITNGTASRSITALQDIQLQQENMNSSALQDIQLQEENTNSTYNEKDMNFSSHLSMNNAVLLTVFDKMKSDNDSAGEMANATSYDGRETGQTELPDPFEICHGWEDHKKGALDIFILSAIGANSSAAEGYYREIKLNGWQAAKHKLAAIKCCIRWTSKRISEYFNPNRIHQKKQLSLLGSQIACPVKGPLQDISGVTIQFARKSCPQNKAEYIRPLIPRAPAESISMAVCLKILYGNIDNMALIYWIEYYLEMKVDKTFTFTYNIANSTQEILRHYYNLGVLEWREFDFPWKGGRVVGEKVPVFWEDEQVVIYDSFSRLHGYTYFAIIDMDEYLLPRKHKNIKDMMKYLVKTYPRAAGFIMNSYIFNKNWGISGTQYGSDMEKYVQRTRLFTGTSARRKNVLLPTRIQFDSYFHTHTFTPKTGYKSIIVDESIAAINHYRVCYYGLHHACDRGRAVIDRDILKVAEKLRTRTKWFSELKDKKG